MGSREKFSFLLLFYWITRLRRQQSDVLLCVVQAGSGQAVRICTLLGVSLVLSPTVPEMTLNSVVSHLEASQQ